MSQLNITTSLEHQTSQSRVNGNLSQTLDSDVCNLPTIALTTSAETLSKGDVVSLGAVGIKCISGGDVLISLDGGSNYPLRVPAGAMQPLRLNHEDKVETQTIQTVADTAGSLDTTYFVVTDANAETWAIGDGTLTHSEDNEISVSTDLTDATAAAVAAAFYAAMIASTAFTALFDVAYDAATDDDLITITDRFTGTRTNIADTGSTGFTLATTQQGAADTDIRIKSASTSVATVLVAPK